MYIHIYIYIYIYIGAKYYTPEIARMNKSVGKCHWKSVGEFQRKSTGERQSFGKYH